MEIRIINMNVNFVYLDYVTNKFTTVLQEDAQEPWFRKLNYLDLSSTVYFFFQFIHLFSINDMNER